MAKLTTNRDRLVRTTVTGEITHPRVGGSVYRISVDGEPICVPGSGGVTINVRVGDPANGWRGDHVEPAVSIKNRESEEANGGLNVLACIGNAAVVLTGEAKGATGRVTGKHGGAEHVMVDFDEATMRKMLPSDRLRVDAWGQGLQLADHPEVTCFSLDPDFLDAWGLEERDGKLRVPVAHCAPAAAMGSGLGRDNAYRGDYDINLFDEATVREYGLEDLRLGDLVAIVDADTTFGRHYRRGSTIIGIIAHCDSYIAGHGPGVTCLLTARDGKIEPVVDPKANIADVLRLR
jgi:hypothetical protein